MILNERKRYKMKCQYCGEDKKLIKAHIIPESFFKPLRADNGDVPYLMTDLQGEFPKKSPIGVYDKTILCRDCEDQFAQWDEYGFKTLVDGEKQLKPLYDQQADGVYIAAGRYRQAQTVSAQCVMASLHTSLRDFTPRHCEERSDVAIHHKGTHNLTIYRHGLAMTENK